MSDSGPKTYGVKIGITQNQNVEAAKEIGKTIDITQEQKLNLAKTVTQSFKL
jgi:hypothetical protein